MKRFGSSGTWRVKKINEDVIFGIYLIYRVIALKTGEWQRKELWSDVSAMFRKNGIIWKIAWLLLCRSLKRLKKENDPNSYSLWLIIGLKWLIWKIHWSADEEGFKNAILQSNQYIGIEREFGVISEIERALIAYRETKKDEV